MTLLVLGLAFILLTAVGLPISFAVGVASVIGTFLLPGVDNATIVQRMLTSINTFPLLAVIFFVFSGVLMARGGIARRLVLMAEVLVGWLPGSLAQIVCVASMFFGGDLMETIPYKNYWYYPAMPISGFLMMVFAVKLVIDEIVRPEAAAITGQTVD